MSEAVDALQARRTKKGKKTRAQDLQAPSITVEPEPQCDDVGEAEHDPQVRKKKKKKGIQEVVCSEEAQAQSGSAIEVKQATQECPLSEHPRKKKNKRKRQIADESNVVDTCAKQKKIEWESNVGDDVSKDEEVPRTTKRRNKKGTKEAGCVEEVQAQSASELEVERGLEECSAEAQPHKKKLKRQVAGESNGADIGVKKEEAENASNGAEETVEKTKPKSNNDFRMMWATMMMANAEVDNSVHAEQKVVNGSDTHESGNANPIVTDMREQREKQNETSQSTALEAPLQTSFVKESALEKNDDDSRRDATKPDGPGDATTKHDAEQSGVGATNHRTENSLLQSRSVSENETPTNSLKICAANLPTSLDKTALWEHFERCGSVRDVYLLKDWYSQMSRGVCFVTFESHEGVQEALKMNDSELIGQKIRVNVAEDKPKGNKDSDKGKKGLSKNSGKGSGKTNSCFALANHAWSTHDGKNGGKGKAKNGASCGKGMGELTNPPVGCLGFIIKRLSFSVSEEDLKECFQACGSGPTRVRILKDSAGNSKGKAFIDFADREALEAAAKMNSMELKGKRFVMEYTLPRGNDITDAAA